MSLTWQPTTDYKSLQASQCYSTIARVKSAEKKLSAYSAYIQRLRSLSDACGCVMCAPWHLIQRFI